MPSFSAVLLAGGKSKRMGRDKALLPLPNSDLLLWQRQWRLLEDLKPEEIFWSGHPRQGLPATALIVADEVPDAGPLAGITACLKVMRSDLLVVLAVDLPQMSSSFLNGLIKQCTSDQGVVVRNGDFFEALAAVYPRRIQTIAQEYLAQGRYALQDLLQKAVVKKLVQPLPGTENTLPFFKNWNLPQDWN